VPAAGDIDLPAAVPLQRRHARFPQKRQEDVPADAEEFEEQQFGVFRKSKAEGVRL